MISLAISVNLVLYGLAGPFCAAIAERLGVRRVIALAMALLATAIFLATQIRQPWQLVVLWGLIVGAGTGRTVMRVRRGGRAAPVAAAGEGTWSLTQPV